MLDRTRNWGAVLSMVLAAALAELAYRMPHNALPKTVLLVSLFALCATFSIRAMRTWTWEHVRLALVVNLMTVVICGSAVR
jgi:uncharacterized membrane protein YfcA